MEKEKKQVTPQKKKQSMVSKKEKENITSKEKENTGLQKERKNTTPQKAGTGSHVETYFIQNESHPRNMRAKLNSMLERQEYTDLLVKCGSYAMKVHKTLLAASSTYFQEKLTENEDTKQILFSGMEFDILRSLIQFIYCGETVAEQSHLPYLAAVGIKFKIKGLEKFIDEVKSKTKADLAVPITIPDPVFLDSEPKYPSKLFRFSDFDDPMQTISSSSSISSSSLLKKKQERKELNKACAKEATASRKALAVLNQQLSKNAGLFVVEESCVEATVENFIPSKRGSFSAADKSAETKMLKHKGITSKISSPGTLEIDFASKDKAPVQKPHTDVRSTITGPTQLIKGFSGHAANERQCVPSILEGIASGAVQYEIVDGETLVTTFTDPKFAALAEAAEASQVIGTVPQAIGNVSVPQSFIPGQQFQAMPQSFQTVSMPQTFQTVSIPQNYVTVNLPQSSEAFVMPHTFEALPMPQSFNAVPMRQTFEAISMPQSFEAVPMPQSFQAIPMSQSFEAVPMPQSFEVLPMPQSFEQVSASETFELVSQATQVLEGYQAFETIPQYTVPINESYVTVNLPQVTETLTTQSFEVMPQTFEAIPMSQTFQPLPISQNFETIPVPQMFETIPMTQTLEGIPLSQNYQFMPQVSAPVPQASEPKPIFDAFNLIPNLQPSAVNVQNEKKRDTSPKPSTSTSRPALERPAVATDLLSEACNLAELWSAGDEPSNITFQMNIDEYNRIISEDLLENLTLEDPEKRDTKD